VEDKANGPAIISELQKEIPGVVAVNPEGGKIARAQATAPLWEAGSIELPDPQLFNCSWIEDYLHNICTFPKAAHDDDMDSTSQALIYMRSRLGGGIVDFYRQQATGEIVPGRTVKPSQLQLDNHRGAQTPSPAKLDSALAQNVIAAVSQGNQIQCNANQYPEIRAALVEAVSSPENIQNESLSFHVNGEIKRLDLLFGVANASNCYNSDMSKGHVL
jgi:hypothetical protein